MNDIAYYKNYKLQNDFYNFETSPNVLQTSNNSASRHNGATTLGQNDT